MTTDVQIIYSQAYSLWDAVLRCGPTELVRAYVELSDVASTPTQLPEDPTLNFRKWLAVTEALKECAFEMLNSGDLRALGYPRNTLFPDAEPEWIATSHWAARKYNWEKAELLSDFHSYRKVKAIIEPSAMENWANRPFEFAESVQEDGGLKYSLVKVIVGSQPPADTDMTQPQKASRSSMEKKIEAAYTRARNKGKLDFTKSLRANVAAIQAEAREKIDPRRTAKIRGLSYETIRRVVGDRFMGDKIEFGGLSSNQ